MIQILEQIDYRYGLIGMNLKERDLPVKSWRGYRIPSRVRKAIIENDLLNLGGVYGDKNAGSPAEFDNLKLILTDDTVEITVWNRGILLATSDDERIQRIHEVLMKLPGARRRL